MDYFTQIRLKDWAIILLVLLNLSVLGVLWQSQRTSGSPPHERMGQGHNPIRDFFEDELNFSAEQMEAFRNSQRQRGRKVRGLRRKSHQLREQMFNLIGQDSVSSATIDSLAFEIGKAEQILEKANFQHFRELREICTDDQRKKFDEMIDQVLKKMGPPPGPGGPRGPGGPGRPGRRPPPGPNP